MARDMPPRTSPVAGSILVAVLLGLLLWLGYREAARIPGGVETIGQVTFTADAPENGPDQTRVLPDDWQVTGPRVRAGRYRATFTPSPDGDAMYGIYIPVLHLDAEILVNGTLIGRTGPRRHTGAPADPFTRFLNPPAYFALPAALLRDGPNELVVRAAPGGPGHGLLGRIHTGPDRLLRPAFETRYALRVTLVEAITAGMVFVALLMTVLWYLRREDSVYGWFALMTLAWAMRNLLVLGYGAGLPGQVLDRAAVVMLGWVVVFMVFSMHRYLGEQRRGMERGLLIAAVAGSIGVALSGEGMLVAHRVWGTLVMGLGGWYLVRMALAFRARSDLKNPFVLPAGLTIVVFGLHDWLLLTGWWPREDGLLFHYSAPIVLAVFGSLLLERFVGVLRQAESLNQELEQRVAAKHRALEDNYRRLREMEHRQVLVDERERFMKEMHDGVGGHLVSMLSMVRNGKPDHGRIERALQSALTDLRIMIDSLNPDEQDIPSLLGAMRARLEPQLADSDLRFEWRVDELPPLPDFGPQKALQVMRILQEAVTNVIRHAGANRIRIEARLERDAHGGESAVVDITDDGRGIAPDHERGHGLANMARRARDIGAGFDIGPADPGTRVRLRFAYPAYAG